MTTAASATGSRPGTAVRVSPRLRKIMLTLHLVTAVGLVGPALVLSVLGVSGLAGADPETVYPAMYLVARAALAPLIIVALAVGITQALITGYGLTRHGWVTTKLIILSVLTIAELTVVVPGLGRAAHAATTAGETVTTTQQITSTVAPTVALILMITAASLGVFKPGRSR